MCAGKNLSGQSTATQKLIHYSSQCGRPQRPHSPFAVLIRSLTAAWLNRWPVCWIRYAPCSVWQDAGPLLRDELWCLRKEREEEEGEKAKKKKKPTARQTAGCTASDRAESVYQGCCLCHGECGGLVIVCISVILVCRCSAHI